MADRPQPPGHCGLAAGKAGPSQPPFEERCMRWAGMVLESRPAQVYQLGWGRLVPRCPRRWRTGDEHLSIFLSRWQIPSGKVVRPQGLAGRAKTTAPGARAPWPAQPQSPVLRVGLLAALGVYRPLGGPGSLVGCMSWQWAGEWARRTLRPVHAGTLPGQIPIGLQRWRVGPRAGKWAWPF